MGNGFVKGVLLLSFAELLNKIRTRSISVFVIQAGGCRGCVDALSMALSEQNTIKGITLTGNPKHADCLLISGCINEKSKEEIMQIYEKIPSPKAVVAAGACACSGSLFRRQGNQLYIVEDVLPVTSWIRGCTPDGTEMLETIVRAMENVKNKQAKGERDKN